MRRETLNDLNNERPGGLNKFQKGHKRPPHAGRQKGSQNKTTRVLKEAILLAAEKVGEDGVGKDGLVGYLKKLARDYPKSYASLLAKVLPYQITGDGGGPVEVKEYRSVDEVAAAIRQRGLPVPRVFN